VKVLVTLGLERKPFHRLARAIDELARRGLLPSDTLLQFGHTPFRGKYCRGVQFLTWHELQDAVATAELVIGHAGVGTVLMALAAGKRPVIMPRSGRLGEHVDDHQERFTKVVADRGLVVSAWTPGELASLVESGDWATPVPVSSDDGPRLDACLDQLLLSWEREDSPS